MTNMWKRVRNAISYTPNQLKQRRTLRNLAFGLCAALIAGQGCAVITTPYSLEVAVPSVPCFQCLSDNEMATPPFNRLDYYSPVYGYPMIRGYIGPGWDDDFHFRYHDRHNRHHDRHHHHRRPPPKPDRRGNTGPNRN